MRRRTVFLVAALLVATGLVGARAATSSTTLASHAPTTPSSQERPEAVTATTSFVPTPGTATAVAPTVHDQGDETAAAPDAGPPLRTIESLTADLDSGNPFAIVEAANQLAERKATSAIANLVRIDIPANPRSAPSVIEALGHLAGTADGTDRRTATDRLLALLAEERARKAPESQANVLSLYTALGETHEPRAATALEAELVDPNVTLSAKTVVIDALVRLHQPTSRAALITLREELLTVVPADAFGEAIRRDLQGAIERALREVP